MAQAGSFVEEHRRTQSSIWNWQKMRRWVDNLSAIPSVDEIDVHTEVPYSGRDMEGMIATRPCRGVSPLIHACRRQSKCMTAHQNCWYNAANNFD